jgi:hypothetical protein
MTFSIDPAKTWRQVKIRYLAAAAGALAAGAIVVSGQALPGASSGPSTASLQAASAVPVLSRAPAPDLLVYIAGSQSEKEALERDTRFSEWFNDPLVGLDPVVTRVVVIGPGEEESLGLLAELVPEAGLTTASGPRLTLVDLR